MLRNNAATQPSATGAQQVCRQGRDFFEHSHCGDELANDRDEAETAEHRMLGDRYSNLE